MRDRNCSIVHVSSEDAQLHFIQLSTTVAQLNAQYPGQSLFCRAKQSFADVLQQTSSSCLIVYLARGATIKHFLDVNVSSGHWLHLAEPGSSGHCPNSV